jgi:uncharacterized protein (TIGR02246 family)
MKTALKVVVVLVCVSAAWAASSGSSSVPVDQQKAVEKAVLDVHAKMMDAEKSRDMDRFFSYILDSDKGCIIQDGVLYKTRKEALDAVKAGFQRLSKVERKYDQTYVTAVSSESALLTATGTVVATTTDGQSVSSPFAVSMVFAVRDGQWKVLQGHYSTPLVR